MQEVEERRWFEAAASDSGRDVSQVFESWWLLLAQHAKAHSDTALAELVDNLRGLASVDLLNIEGEYFSPEEIQRPAVPIPSESLSARHEPPLDAVTTDRELPEVATMNIDLTLRQMGPISSKGGSFVEEPLEAIDDPDDHPAPPPGPPAEERRKRPRIVFKQSGSKPSSLKLKLKSKKLKPATLQKSESKGPYNTRGVKLTGSFLQRSGAEEGEGDESSANEEYGEEEEEGDLEEEEERRPKPGDRVTQRQRTSSTVSEAEKRRTPSAPKSVSSRQSIMKSLGMRR